ncbi:MAG: trigger factor [Planctomycetales bacterium]|nr:trigger factor [Planctomycetales bacterium]
MATSENDTTAGALDADNADAIGSAESGDDAPEKLSLDVKVDSTGACTRHVTVSVPREDIERYFDKAFGDMMETAAVPGFRLGRAPRKLIESRYRKDVADQVKGSLLMDSMGQVADEENLAAISEPDLDVTAVVLPETGPLTFEFDLEVRPEFDLPKWEGLAIERPMREFSDEDVTRRLETLLASRGRLVPTDAPATPGDYVTTKLTFKDGDTVLSSSDEEVIRIRPVLSFRDTKIEKFDKLMKNAKPGDVKEVETKLTDDAPNEALRGKKVKAIFEILDVKRLELPQLSAQLLEDLGGFDSADELREAVRRSLERKLQYAQQRRAREQILRALTAATDWDLPPELLKRQSLRELQRSVLELRRSGFSEEEIRAHQNELLQNSRASTAQALKEHFVLERLAEDQGIEDEPSDYDVEIALIAEQSGETPRRVRAQLEKRDMMDSLRNQIIERKALDLIMSKAKFKDVAYELEDIEAEAVDQSAGGDAEDEIPAAEAETTETAEA